MKLFLAAEAKHPDSLAKLQNYTGGLAGKKITYIPTAANGLVYGGWKLGQSIRTVQTLGAEVNIVELESQSFQDVVAKVGQPDILWMAGGQSGYLLYWLRRSGLDKALPRLLEQGTLYVGSSAGSMVCAHTQQAGEWYIGEPEPGAGLIPGLGLVNFEIYPHYEDELHDQIDTLWTKGKLYLLKNGEVITVEDGRVEVLGTERIIEK